MNILKKKKQQKYESSSDVTVISTNLPKIKHIIIPSSFIRFKLLIYIINEFSITVFVIKLCDIYFNYLQEKINFFSVE